MKSPRVGAIIFNKDKGEILLMKRHNLGIMKIFPDASPDYYVIPGGGMEDGETIEQTALREIKEETNLEIKLDEILFEYDRDEEIIDYSGSEPKIVIDKRKEYYFLVTEHEGIPEVGEPERSYMTADNSFELIWVKVAELNELNLKPEVYKSLLIDKLKDILVKLKSYAKYFG